MGTLLRIVPNKVPTFGMILIFNYKCGAYRTISSCIKCNLLLCIVR